MSREDAARIGGMDRQTLRDWVHRFNAQGPDGLKDLRAKGASPRLLREQLAAFGEVVETGPDRAKDGVAHWRRIDLLRVIEERFGTVYHERTIGKILKQLGISYISARQCHPDQKATCRSALRNRLSVCRHLRRARGRRRARHVLRRH
jgi:transposase